MAFVKHCKNGHKRTAENTKTDARGRRECKICRSDVRKATKRRVNEYGEGTPSWADMQFLVRPTKYQGTE